jgi:thioredoxin-like negative regulator of GroEL
MSNAGDVERVLRELANAPSALERWSDGAECPSEHVLAAFAEGRLEAGKEAQVRGHLSRCGACVGDVRAALDELAAIAAETARDAGSAARRGLRLVEPTRGPRRPVWPVWPVWIGLAAAAVLLVVFGPRLLDGGGARRAKAVELARVEAIAARIPRGPADEAERAFRDGLAHYQAEAWSEAEAKLAEAGVLAPDRADVALYRGSALLLLERSKDALPYLELACAADGPAGHEARWQLAQALLSTGAIAEAVGELDQLLVGGHRAAQAVALRAELANLGF